MAPPFAVAGVSQEGAMLKETGATDLTNQIDAASDPVTSTLAVFEAVTAIRLSRAGWPRPLP
jgi:uncharacterized protein with PIN domain